MDRLCSTAAIEEVDELPGLDEIRRLVESVPDYELVDMRPVRAPLARLSGFAGALEVTEFGQARLDLGQRLGRRPRQSLGRMRVPVDQLNEKDLPTREQLVPLTAQASE